MIDSSSSSSSNEKTINVTITGTDGKPIGPFQYTVKKGEVVQVPMGADVRVYDWTQGEEIVAYTLVKGQRV